MMAQDLPLFMQPPAARRRDPETSHQAESWLRSRGILAQQERAVLAALKEHPGCTSQELARHLPFGDRYVASRRLAGLAEKGLVRRGPKRWCNVSHMSCITWYAGKAERSVGTLRTMPQSARATKAREPAPVLSAPILPTEEGSVTKAREPAPVLSVDERRRLREHLATSGDPATRRFLHDVRVDGDQVHDHQDVQVDGDQVHGHEDVQADGVRVHDHEDVQVDGVPVHGHEDVQVHDHQDVQVDGRRLRERRFLSEIGGEG